MVVNKIGCRVGFECNNGKVLENLFELDTPTWKWVESPTIRCIYYCKDVAITVCLGPLGLQCENRLNHQ
jgi:hypothetical protein